MDALKIAIAGTGTVGSGVLELILKNKIHNNDIILIKCSNSTEINKFTKTLIEKETRFD